MSASGSVTPGKPKAGMPATGSGSPRSVSGSPMLSPNRYIALANLVEENEEINETNKEVWKCQKCCKDFSDEGDMLLECQRCKDHYCIKCLGKSEAEYQLLNDSDLMWFCINCRGKVERNIVIDRDIEEKCNELMKAFENRMTTLETAVIDKCSKLEAREIAKEEIQTAVADKCSKSEAKEIIKEVQMAVAEKCSKEETRELIREELDQRMSNKKAAEGSEGSNEVTTDTDPGEKQGTNVNTVLTEINERKLRENNIIFYNVIESDSTSRDERLLYDQEKVKEIIDECSVELESQEIQKIVRLGKFDKNKKKRPLLVSLKNSEKKAKIFKGSKHLKDNELFKDIGIANDLTQAERQNEKKMYEEAKEMSKNCSGEFKFRVRGPPWARKIIKTRVENKENPAGNKD